MRKESSSLASSACFSSGQFGCMSIHPCKNCRVKFVIPRQVFDLEKSGLQFGLWRVQADWRGLVCHLRSSNAAVQAPCVCLHAHAYCHLTTSKLKVVVYGFLSG